MQRINLGQIPGDVSLRPQFLQAVIQMRQVHQLQGGLIGVFDGHGGAKHLTGAGCAAKKAAPKKEADAKAGPKKEVAKKPAAKKKAVTKQDKE